MLLDFLTLSFIKYICYCVKCIWEAAEDAHSVTLLFRPVADSQYLHLIWGSLMEELTNSTRYPPNNTHYSQWGCVHQHHTSDPHHVFS